MFVAAFCSAAFLCSAADTANGPSTISARFAGIAAKAEAQQLAAVTGQEGWLFLTAELRHLGIRRFWGEDSKAASRAANSAAADPLPASLDFNAQLKQAGIELILMPVPPKAAVYCDKALDRAALPEGRARTDEADAAFYQACTEQGLKVLDLGPAFRRAREADAAPVYCRTDSHWSGAAA
jgi:alginate O-acetyltransferase complex protein AlgJ